MAFSINPVAKINNSTSTFKDMKIGFDTLCSNQILIRDYVCTFDSLIGDLGLLDTEEKDSLVEAINELHNDIEVAISGFDNILIGIQSTFNELSGIVGDIGVLKTDDQTTLVASINEIHDQFDDFCQNFVKTNGTEGFWNTPSTEDCQEIVTYSNDIAHTWPPTFDIYYSDFGTTEWKLMTPKVASPLVGTGHFHKISAENYGSARLLANDLSDMVGFALQAGTTGGSNNNIFLVDNVIDNKNVREIGTLRWAIDRANNEANGGIVLIDPSSQMTIYLDDQITIGDNVTIDAPGRNTTISSPTSVTKLKIEGSNNIIRRLRFTSTEDVIDDRKRDAIWIDPQFADGIWVHENTFADIGDGAIDIATLNEPVGNNHRITISNNLFYNHDKCCLWGNLSCYTDPLPAYCSNPLAETRRIQITSYNNIFDHTGQRHPKVFGNTYCHSVNNTIRINRVLSPDNIIDGGYGIQSTTGAHVLSEGDVVMTVDSTVSNGIFAFKDPSIENPSEPGTYLDGPGAIRINGSMSPDGLLVEEHNSTLVGNPPYTLPYRTIPQTREGIIRMLSEQYTTVGCDSNSGPAGTFIWDPNSEIEPNGKSVLAEGLFPGRYILKDYQKVSNTSQNVLIPRLSIGDTITVNSANRSISINSGFHTIALASGTSGEVRTIFNGDSGDLLVLRLANNSDTITLQDELGNMTLAGDFVMNSNRDTITLLFNQSINQWIEISRSDNG